MKLSSPTTSSLRALRTSQGRLTSIRPLTAITSRTTYDHPQKLQSRRFNNSKAKMSFSNTDTGSKSADPYTSKNKDETSVKEKVEDLNAFIDNSKFGMMTTKDSNGKLVSRCMAVAGKENVVDLLFHTNTESGKTDDLQSHNEINISFLNSSGEWASVSGTASIVTDRDFVHKHYSKSLKAWLGDLGDGKHDGGPDDPRIGVIKVKTLSATYALVRKSALGRAAEMAQGIVTGSAPAVNKLRELSESEIETYRASQKMVN